MRHLGKIQGGHWFNVVSGNAVLKRRAWKRDETISKSLKTARTILEKKKKNPVNYQMAGPPICIMEWTSRPVHGWEATNRSCTCLSCINFLLSRVSRQLTWPQQSCYYALIQRKIERKKMSYGVKYKNVHEPVLPVYNKVDWLLISNIYASVFSFTVPWMVHLIHVSRKGNETLILLRSKGPLRVDRCIYKSTWTAVFQPRALLIQTLSASEIMISIPPHPLTKLFGSASLF